MLPIAAELHTLGLRHNYSDSNCGLARAWAVLIIDPGVAVVSHLASLPIRNQIPVHRWADTESWYKS